MQVKTVTAGMKLEKRIKRPIGGDNDTVSQENTAKETEYIQKLVSPQMKTEYFSKMMHTNVA